MIERGLLKSKLVELKRICEVLKIEPSFEVLIVECETLEEFHRITNRPYSIGAVYSKGVIVTQPFAVLRSKGVLEEVLVHELLHHVISINFDLPGWIQEGLILYLTGAQIEKLPFHHRECLLRFMREVDHEEIDDLLARYRRIPCFEPH
ncbi:hypothetical protein AS159_04580 [Thermotoga sp. Ku-13t]|nr:hypothetical protein AS159_04580 [Thermotoga sp. Ku-13t]